MSVGNFVCIWFAMTIVTHFFAPPGLTRFAMFFFGNLALLIRALRLNGTV